MWDGRQPCLGTDIAKVRLSREGRTRGRRSGNLLGRRGRKGRRCLPAGTFSMRCRRCAGRDLGKTQNSRQTTQNYMAEFFLQTAPAN